MLKYFLSIAIFLAMFDLSFAEWQREIINPPDILNEPKDNRKGVIFLQDGQVCINASKTTNEVKDAKFVDVSLLVNISKTASIPIPFDYYTEITNTQLDEQFIWTGSDPVPQDQSWSWTCGVIQYQFEGITNNRFQEKICNSIQANLEVQTPDRSSLQRRGAEMHESFQPRNIENCLIHWLSSFSFIAKTFPIVFTRQYSIIGPGSSAGMVNGYTDTAGPFHRYSIINDLRAKVEGSSKSGGGFSSIKVRFSPANQ